MTKRSPLISIFLIILVDILGMTIILPLLPFYAESMGATPFVVGLLISTYALCQLIAGPILGQISDRIGRKPVLIVSQCGTFAGFLLLAFSGTLLPVFIARIIDGLTAGNITVAQAYIADVTEESKRTQSFALIGIAFGIGFLIGPAVSAFLVRYSPQYPIFLAAALSATSIMATTFLLPGTKPSAEERAKHGTIGWTKTWSIVRDPGVLSLLVQFSAFAVTFSLFMSGFALFAERRFTWQGMPFQTEQVGYALAFMGFAGIIIQGGLIRRLVKMMGEARLVPAGFLTMSVALAMLAAARGIRELLVILLIFAFGNSVMRPALSTMLTQAVGRMRQGLALGMTQSLMSIAQIICPALGGELIQRQLLGTWALLGAASSALGLLWCQFGRVPTLKAEKETEPSTT